MIFVLITFILTLAFLSFIAVDKAAQIGNPNRKSLVDSLLVFFKMKKMEEKKEVDIVKIFAELEQKAAQQNPNLLFQIQSYNSNSSGMQNYNNYLSAMNQVSAPVASNKVS
jgi:hypothetical protein